MCVCVCEREIVSIGAVSLSFFILLHLRLSCFFAFVFLLERRQDQNILSVQLKRTLLPSLPPSFPPSLPPFVTDLSMYKDAALLAHTHKAT